jgi:FKBP-type peptidyl-prolyl cis-trans isomerase
MSEVKRPKGLRVSDTRKGDGRVAAKGTVVFLHYDCFLPRGDKLDSSRDRGGPIQVWIGKRRVFPAVEYGVPGMAEGGLRTVTVSPQLTYYERKVHPELPEGAALRYEIELFRVSDEWSSTGLDPDTA